MTENSRLSAAINHVFPAVAAAAATAAVCMCFILPLRLPHRHAAHPVSVPIRHIPERARKKTLCSHKITDAIPHRTSLWQCSVGFTVRLRLFCLPGLNQKTTCPVTSGTTLHASHELLACAYNPGGIEPSSKPCAREERRLCLIAPASPSTILGFFGLHHLAPGFSPNRVDNPQARKVALLEAIRSEAARKGRLEELLETNQVLTSCCCCCISYVRRMPLVCPVFVKKNRSRPRLCDREPRRKKTHICTLCLRLRYLVEGSMRRISAYFCLRRPFLHVLIF